MNALDVMTEREFLNASNKCNADELKSDMLVICGREIGVVLSSNRGSTSPTVGCDATVVIRCIGTGEMVVKTPTELIEAGWKRLVSVELYSNKENTNEL